MQEKLAPVELCACAQELLALVLVAPSTLALEILSGVAAETLHWQLDVATAEKVVQLLSSLERARVPLVEQLMFAVVARNLPAVAASQSSRPTLGSVAQVVLSRLVLERPGLEPLARSPSGAALQLREVGELSVLRLALAEAGSVVP
jgi:hypothetical protein